MLSSFPDNRESLLRWANQHEPWRHVAPENQDCRPVSGASDRHIPAAFHPQRLRRANPIPHGCSASPCLSALSIPSYCGNDAWAYRSSSCESGCCAIGRNPSERTCRSANSRSLWQHTVPEDLPCSHWTTMNIDRNNPQRPRRSAPDIRRPSPQDPCSDSIPSATFFSAVPRERYAPSLQFHARLAHSPVLKQIPYSPLSWPPSSLDYLTYCSPQGEPEPWHRAYRNYLSDCDPLYPRI